MIMLRLIDLLRLSGVTLGDYKIHCATDNKDSGWYPLEAYFAGKFEEGQSLQSQKNFECDQIVSLINLGNSKRWLFVGVYRVDGVRAVTVKDWAWSGFRYSLRPLPGLEHLVGRAVVDLRNPVMAATRSCVSFCAASVLSTRRTSSFLSSRFATSTRALITSSHASPTGRKPDDS
jgi:hypothetical protein